MAITSAKKVNITKIHCNPYQPSSRIAIPTEEAEKFGKSILEHGMIQTPIIRPAGPDGEFQMGDGWIRLMAHMWLVDNGHPEFQEIRVDIRKLSDQQMADLVMEANTIRKDLTVFDEGELYKRYLEEFGLTQADLAQKHNLTQGEISNTIRLLDLPDSIKERVLAGTLSKTHARHLLRIAHLPQEIEETALSIEQYHHSVDHTSNRVAQIIYGHSLCLNPEAPRYNQPPVFDLTECKKCDQRQKLGEPYRSDKKEWRCLRPECWDAKQQEVTLAAKQESLAELEKKFPGLKVYSREQIRHDQFAVLEGHYGGEAKVDNPKECKACPHDARAIMETYFEDSYDVICTNLKCHRGKVMRHTREANKVAREKDAKFTQELAQLSLRGSEKPNQTDTLRLATELVLRHARTDATKDAADMFGFPTDKNGRTNIRLITKDLETKTFGELLQILLGSVLSVLRREYGSDTVMKQAVSKLDGTFEAYKAEVVAFQDANCRGCEFVEQELLGSANDCCGSNWRKRINKDGACEGRKVPGSEDQIFASEDAEVEEGEPEPAFPTL